MIAQGSEPGGADRTHHEIGDGENQVGQRKRAPEAEPVRQRSANDGQEPDPAAKHPGEAAGPLDIEVQALVQVTRQHGENGIVRKPLKKLTDVGDPERPFEPGADFLEALREGQSGS